MRRVRKEEEKIRRMRSELSAERRRKAWEAGKGRGRRIRVDGQWTLDNNNIVCKMGFQLI